MNLGWCVHGPLPKSVYEHHVNVSVDVKENSFSEENLFERSLDESIKKYFVLDSVGIAERTRSNSINKKALNILKMSVRVGNESETGSLWKDDRIFVPESRQRARERLFTLEKKLDRDDEYASLYYAEMNRLFDCGTQKNLKNRYLVLDIGIYHILA